ncbi:MAG: enoyl-CoA hydratase/isomerase family protein [Myxococcota bacterium]
MSQPSVHVKIDEHGVATLTLDDAPRRNAMTEALGDRLSEVVERVRKDAALRAVVLTGAGDAFSAGGDLAMLEHLRTVGDATAREHMLAFYARYLRILDFTVPVVAAVRGPAIGAGLCVAIACDVVVMDQDAKLAFNFVKLGLHPGMGATYFLPLRVGLQRATELLTTGRRFTGRDAVTMGLALEAVPGTEVLPRAQALAREMAQSAPVAVQLVKKALGVDREALRAALEVEAQHQARTYASEDMAEGLRAAKEKREARFVGR